MDRFPTQLLTYKQAATTLQVTERTVYELMRTGRLRAVRIGRSIRFDRADIEAFIQFAKVDAVGESPLAS